MPIYSKQRFFKLFLNLYKQLNSTDLYNTIKA